MKSTHPIAAALAAIGLGAVAAAAGFAQDDPFVKLKSYDFQSRGPAAISVMIQQSLADPAARERIETGLVGVLDDPAATFAGKQEACRLLWPIGTARSVPAVAKLLTDSKLSDAARYALERNTDSSAGHALRDALSQSQGSTRIGIINSLGDRGDADAVADLKPLSMATDGGTAEAAAIALGKIGTTDALDALDALPNKNPQVYQAILRSAGRLGSERRKKGDAEDAYLRLSGGENPPNVQIAALRGLAAMRSSKAAPLALTDLRSSDANVQIAAATVVQEIGDSTTTQQSIAAWPGLIPSVQIALLSGLADRGEATAAPLADTALASPDLALRLAGIRAAARLKGARAVPALARIAAQGSTPADRQAARAALATLPGKDAADEIMRLARTGDEPTRVALISVLADRGTTDARAQLLEAAGGADQKQAVDALKALGKSGGADDYPALVRVLTNTNDPAVRDAAQNAVVATAARMGGNRDQAAAPIFAALPGAPAERRTALLGTLAEIGGDRALVELTRATTATEPEVKEAALTALSETWGDPRPMPTLLTVAKTDPSKSYRVQALRGYLRLAGLADRMGDEDRVARVAEALTVAERPEEKRQALSVLRDCRVPSAVTLAAHYLDDPAVFDEAADAVVYLAAPQKKGRATLRAVKGPATTAALDKIVLLSKDEALRAKAQSLR